MCCLLDVDTQFNYHLNFVLTFIFSALSSNIEIFISIISPTKYSIISPGLLFLPNNKVLDKTTHPLNGLQAIP